MEVEGLVHATPNGACSRPQHKQEQSFCLHVLQTLRGYAGIEYKQLFKRCSTKKVL